MNEQPLPPMPGGMGGLPGGGGLGSPAGLPPMPGGMGGPGGGLPPMPPPPMGGGGPGLPPPGLGGPPGGMPGMGQQSPQVMKIESPNVWKILEKLLNVEK